MVKQTRKILLAILLGVIAFGVMIAFFTLEQSLMVAVIVLMVTLWTNEGLPLAVVSLLPIVLFPATGILSTKETAVNYANPIIYLFLGGFLIAIAVEKTGLHKVIASRMLDLFPNSVRGIIFALIITSGLLSSILSNTTTTLLLLPIALFLTEDVKLKMRFALSIAYGASIGGILTPIGTPPNLILLGIMNEMGMEAIPFVQWMYMVAPLVFLMFIAVGYILGAGVKNLYIEADLSNKTLTADQKKVVYLLFGLIILLLVNAPIKPYYNGLGLSEPGILLAAGLLLFVPPFSILEWMDDKESIPYRIMFLFGAGFAIAAAVTKTGMAEEIASHLMGFANMPMILFLLIIAAMITFTTEITSNTALISIMLPILYKVAEQTGMDATLIMMVATVCASYAFMLPIATPPNAIAMSSGAVSVKTMATYGIMFNLMGILLIVTIARSLWIQLL
ncbi:DASS family sodium-coupled anion symporter [Sulfurovum sp. XTW-4]|uniref:DASS family sodium-coupled anion symporter n=1 Tax=Sulfurovum xiamenensis TaxID=3019066 RepID=A0ABT7QS58_9BACT|nr:DASS family sodium-coupled anion symporter [Sulfurovum xiamenensis]MDM5263389.1 DASS family sodium-coupled anion symporter [Sulfurovum xiamenensis]